MRARGGVGCRGGAQEPPPCPRCARHRANTAEGGFGSGGHGGGGDGTGGSLGHQQRAGGAVGAIPVQINWGKLLREVLESNGDIGVRAALAIAVF